MHPHLIPSAWQTSWGPNSAIEPLKPPREKCVWKNVQTR